MKPDFEGTWNAQADEHNTWVDLCEDEKLAWAYAAGLERAAEIAKVTGCAVPAMATKVATRPRPWTTSLMPSEPIRIRPMTDDELRALAEAAMPGPWTAEKDVKPVDGRIDGRIWVNANRGLHGVAMCSDGSWIGPCEANARYIAAASPEVVRGLLDRAEKAEADLAAARAALLAVIDDDGCTCDRCMKDSEHAPAIEAARADE